MKNRLKPFMSAADIDLAIIIARGERVILAADLAKVYGVETRALNQAVKRNIEKFPVDFVFQLTRREAAILSRSRSQFVMLKRGGNVKYLPYAFTEHGAIMAANILNSKRAVQMSVFVVRAFVKMRQTMSANKALLEKLNELEGKLTKRLDTHEQAIVYVLSELRKLSEPPRLVEPKRRAIGFGREEDQ
jgi:phage regulator Rha-like protein